jgi:hypothetical protein
MYDVAFKQSAPRQGLAPPLRKKVKNTSTLSFSTWNYKAQK